MLCIHHTSQLNFLYKTLSSIIKVYEDQVAFSFPIKKQELVDFYAQKFKKLISVEAVDISLVLPKKKRANENPNSTPIHNQVERVKNQRTQKEVAQQQLQTNVKEMIHSPLLHNLFSERKKPPVNPQFEVFRQNSIHSLDELTQIQARGLE